MKALIVLNGGDMDLTFLRGIIEEHDTVIGVDGGNRSLIELGLEPDIAIGDFDSFDPGVLNRAEIMRYPHDKDEIDAELALDLCWNMGFESVTVVGWMGDRPDMVYALFGLLGRYPQGWVVLESEKLSVGMVSESVVLDARPGEMWSILPLGERAVLSLEGFEYEIEDREMRLEKPYGVSNVSRSERVGIEVKEGKVIYFRWKRRPS